MPQTLRRGLLDLFASYGARIHLVHVECDAATPPQAQSQSRRTFDWDAA